MRFWSALFCLFNIILFNPSVWAKAPCADGLRKILQQGSKQDSDYILERLSQVPATGKLLVNLLDENKDFASLVRLQILGALYISDVNILPLTTDIRKMFDLPDDAQGTSFPPSLAKFRVVQQAGINPSPSFAVTANAHHENGMVYIKDSDDFRDALVLVHELFHQNFYFYFNSRIKELEKTFPQFIQLKGPTYEVQEQFFHYALELHVKLSELYYQLALYKSAPDRFGLIPDIKKLADSDIPPATWIPGKARELVLKYYKITDPRVLELGVIDFPKMFPGLPL